MSRNRKRKRKARRLNAKANPQAERLAYEERERAKAAERALRAWTGHREHMRRRNPHGVSR